MPLAGRRVDGRVDECNLIVTNHTPTFVGFEDPPHFTHTWRGLPNEQQRRLFILGIERLFRRSLQPLTFLWTSLRKRALLGHTGGHDIGRFSPHLAG